ncbi:hypothetical protein LKK83_01065 [Phormidium sp. CCY1219]|nr:hypothetical protein [Phormidium sp. CCY1219]
MAVSQITTGVLSRLWAIACRFILHRRTTAHPTLDGNRERAIDCAQRR